MAKKRSPKGQFAALVATKHDDEKETLARIARMEQMEERLYVSSAAILEAQIDFATVSPDTEEPPKEWVKQFGALGAAQRLAVAKTGWLPRGQTPSGIETASKMFAGISAARARRRDAVEAPRELPVVISIPAPTSQAFPGQDPLALPEKDIE